MKINVTMLKTVSGCSKPMADFAAIEASELQEDALDKAMKALHVTGKVDARWPTQLIDEDETIIGVIYCVFGDDGAEYRFILEEVY